MSANRLPTLRRRLAATSTSVMLARETWQRLLADVTTAEPLSELLGDQSAAGFGRLKIDIRPGDITVGASMPPSRLLALLTAAGGLVTARYAGRQDLLAGTPAVGSALRTLIPIRVLSCPAESAGDLIDRAERTIIQGFATVDGLTDEDAAVLGAEEAWALCVCADDIQTRPHQADAILAGRMGEDGLTLQLDVRADRVSPAIASTLSLHIGRAIRFLTADPGVAVDRFELLDADERTVMLGLADGGKHDSEPDLLLTRIDRFAAVSPGRIALVYEDRELTWCQLHHAARAIADSLARQKVGAGDLVGMLLRRGDLPVIAALGSFMVGAVYVPIDPDQPQERTEFMIRDANITVVIAEARADVPSQFDGVVVLLDDPLTMASRSGPRRANPGPAAPAYAIYTSGTTGQPKAVLTTHRAFASTCAAYQEPYELDTDAVALQMGSIAFDVFNGDFGRSLYYGGTMVVCADEDRTDVTRLAELVARRGVTILETTPALAGMLAEALAAYPMALASLRVLISSADGWHWADYRSVQALIGDQVKVINTYGVTEAAVDQTIYLPDGRRESPEQDGAYVPIGQAMRGVTALVLDDAGRLQPHGVIGELCLSGDPLATGYLGRPALTASRFVPDPYGPPGARLYRTGDRVRYNHFGQIEFGGRRDHQVKLRGFRIELGEIAHILRRHPDVHMAVAVVRTSEQGVQRLVSYVTGAGQLDVAALAALCAQALPDFMVPSQIIQLERMPLNRNGKLDRKALPEPATQGTGLVAAPASPAERVLAEVWAELLGVTNVGSDDDFFALGGHSLLALKLVTRLRSLCVSPVSVRDVFENSTLQALAARLNLKEG